MNLVDSSGWLEYLTDAPGDYDLAKASGEEAIPFEQAIEEIESGGG